MGVLCFLEVQAGFEPADNGVADRGLTTWLLHQNSNYPNIISKFFCFVNRKNIFYQKNKDEKSLTLKINSSIINA